MLSHVRRVIARVAPVAAALLPALAMVVDGGAKRW